MLPALLIGTVFSLTGFFNRGDVLYRAFFKNAGGLRPGAEVRYAGGPPVGRIEDVRTDPHDTTRMEIIFRVKPDVPVKTDSVATISSNSPLSDNFLGILPGSNPAQRAPAGSTLKSKEYVGFDELEAEHSGTWPASQGRSGQPQRAPHRIASHRRARKRHVERSATAKT